MPLKLEHKCTRCTRVTLTEVKDVTAAAAAEERDTKRGVVLKDIQAFLGGIDPELLPDLFILRRGHPAVVQTVLCDDEDAKRSCADRVAFIVEECMTFDPRKPKTKKPKGDAPPVVVGEPAVGTDTATGGLTPAEKKAKKNAAAAASQ